MHNSFRERRLALGLPQSEVARRAGVQQRQVSLFERGGDVTLSTLQKLSLALDLTLVPVPREAAAKVTALLKTERVSKATLRISPLASQPAPQITPPPPSLLDRYQVNDGGKDNEAPSNG